MKGLAGYTDLWETLQPGLGTQVQGLTCQAGLGVSTVSDEIVLALGEQEQAGAPWTLGSWPAVGARPVEFWGRERRGQARLLLDRAMSPAFLSS